MFCNNKMNSPTTMTILMLSIFIVLFSFPLALGSTFSKIQLPPTLTGPESVAFDPRGGGPYIVVTDGRVLKRLGPNTGFVDFATTSTQRTKQLCDGTKNPDLGPICGRPLGFSFNSITGDLYIADAYLGLHVVGPNGGLATRLATCAEGVPFRLLNGVDVDQITRYVYFTDSSTTFELRNITQPNFVPDSTGRLMRYDPRTKEVKVLLRGLFVAVGPAASLDGSFVVVSELFAKRIIRFWVTGLKRGTSEVLLNLPGNPNKIKRTPLGDFWVAVNVMNNQQGRLITTPQGFRFNAFGNVLRNFGLQEQYFNTSINVIQEQPTASLYVGSRDVDFVGVYSNILIVPDVGLSE